MVQHAYNLMILLNKQLIFWPNLWIWMWLNLLICARNKNHVVGDTQTQTQFTSLFHQHEEGMMWKKFVWVSMGIVQFAHLFLFIYNNVFHIKLLRCALSSKSDTRVEGYQLSHNGELEVGIFVFVSPNIIFWPLRWLPKGTLYYCWWFCVLWSQKKTETFVACAC